MKSISELTDFYYKKLYPILEQLEEERKRIKKRFTTISFIYSFTLFLIFFFIDNSYDFQFFLIFFILLTIGLTLLYNYLIKNYRNDFKEKIITPLIKEIDKNLHYYPDRHIPTSYFSQSKLFNREAEEIDGNDYVQGYIDNIKIEFSDLHAQYTHKNSKESHQETIFMGIFIVSEFHKNFQGETIVLPDSAQKIFGDLIGSWLQSTNTTQTELIKMDHPDFEKEFVVYGTDQIEARYILTHSLMQKILNYKKRTKHPIYLSFIDGKVYMAIEYNDDMFEPSVFHSLLEYKIAMEYITTLHLAIGIVEELKLNQKLWSKV